MTIHVVANAHAASLALNPDTAVNYRTIGAVIGHEITHGFDSQGRQYDPRGKLCNGWTPRANAEFKQRTDVLVDQGCLSQGVWHRQGRDPMWCDPKKPVVIW